MIAMGRSLPANAGASTTLHERLGRLPMDLFQQMNPGRFTGDDGWPPMFGVLANHSATQWRVWYLDAEQAIDDVPASLLPL
jgi:hypothetical protein